MAGVAPRQFQQARAGFPDSSFPSNGIAENDVGRSRQSDERVGIRRKGEYRVSDGSQIHRHRRSIGRTQKGTGLPGYPRAGKGRIITKSQNTLRHSHSSTRAKYGRGAEDQRSRAFLGDGRIGNFSRPRQFITGGGVADKHGTWRNLSIQLYDRVSDSGLVRKGNRHTIRICGGRTAVRPDIFRAPDAVFTPLPQKEGSRRIDKVFAVVGNGDGPGHAVSKGSLNGRYIGQARS